MLTNLAALITPKLYMRVTKETGRGGDCATDTELESYTFKVVEDYLKMLNMAKVSCNNFFKNKVIVEYGPGDFLGVPLILFMLGAKRIYCIDRFPLIDEGKYSNLYKRLMHRYLGDANCTRSWDKIINKNIIYLSGKDGVWSLTEKADLIISRAVLEHCNDLEKTLSNMHENLKTNGIMIHRIDLTSHGTHIKVPLDFLCYSNITWRLMTSQKGWPNRWRRNIYKQLLNQYSFQVLYEESLNGFSEEELASLRPLLARDFRNLPNEELLCSDYFFVAEKLK